jgi:hypothetical protein
VTQPLVGPDVDLRGLPFMPLDTVRLMDSDLFALSTGDEFKAALSLWCKAWQQVPAASLPDDDRVLAHLSGTGSRWRKIKAAAMRGFVLCTDGRWYHPVIAEKATEAWKHRLAQRARADKRWHNHGNAAAYTTAQPAAMQGTVKLSKEEKTKAPAPKRRSRSLEVPMPEGFAISDRVRKWAAEKGHEALLSDYFEAFVGLAKAKGYTYVDWDDALMNSIRGDWGKVREQQRPVNGKHVGGSWWESEAGILAKGKELDMTPYGGEGWPEFKARINQRLRAQSGSR